jgi:glycine dehydrogenase subunit 1
MRFTPHTDADRREMLARVGVGSVDQLFESIPADLRPAAPIDLPPALSELEVTRELHSLARRNRGTSELACFAGAGAYDHYIPAIVDTIISRPEFYTAYTPYQAEVSQGTLQAIYEYQSLICRLYGMEVANASMYDGPTALAEAVQMALGITKRTKVLLPTTLHPNYESVTRAYASGHSASLVQVGSAGCTADLAALKSTIDDQTAAVVIQHPNFYGCLEPVEAIAGLARQAGALLIAVCDPHSLGLLPPPGEWGADIAVGEGQGLGIPLSYGGPYLGIMAARRSYIRSLPGRIVARTEDESGRTGYVLALQTREQHIRRERASSNICTNQALCALAASAYLAWAGPRGLAEIARQCFSKSHYLAGRIAAIPGFAVAPEPFLKEFLVAAPIPAAQIVAAGLTAGLVAGVDIGRFHAERENDLLIAVTERRTRAEMDALVELLTTFAA